MESPGPWHSRTATRPSGTMASPKLCVLGPVPTHLTLDTDSKGEILKASEAVVIWWMASISERSSAELFVWVINRI
jgi:hypothetical protein